MSEWGRPGVTWESEPVPCKGGLVLNSDSLTQGTTQQGTALVLQNFEPALEGGYRRINGYQKFDTHTVPGDANSPVLGVKPALGGVFAVRFNTTNTTNDIFFSTGSGWGSPINGATHRAGAVTKARMIAYSVVKPTIAGVDGKNPAWKYDGTTFTTLNSTGAPADPAYIELFNASVALAGYSNGVQNVTISAPNSDTDFLAADGAVEINVGDVITGLKVFRNSLYIFCVNRIMKLTGTDSTTYVLSPVTTQIGCIDSDTIQEVGGDVVYLAPDGFRSVAGTYNIGDTDLSLQSKEIQPVIRNVLNASTSQKYSSCVVRKKSQYRCFFYDSTIPKANTQGVIGKLVQGNFLSGFNQTFTTYEWSTTLGIQPYCSDSYFDSGVERVVMGDPTNGFVYSLESGNDFDGVAITAVFSSPYLTFKDVTLRKVMQKVNVYTEFEGSNTINLGLNFDFADPAVLQPGVMPLINVGSYPTYGNAVYGTDVYAGIAFPVFKTNLLGSGFTTQFNYTSVGGAPYRIDAYQITYSQKGRR